MRRWWKCRCRRGKHWIGRGHRMIVIIHKVVQFRAREIADFCISLLLNKYFKIVLLDKVFQVWCNVQDERSSCILVLYSYLLQILGFHFTRHERFWVWTLQHVCTAFSFFCVCCRQSLQFELLFIFLKNNWKYKKSVGKIKFTCNLNIIFLFLYSCIRQRSSSWFLRIWSSFSFLMYSTEAFSIDPLFCLTSLTTSKYLKQISIIY